jgi:ParB family chromosome partitioning protein
VEKTLDTAKVLNIKVQEIGPNPHNPRRLFDEEHMSILRESVQKLGVLVPVTLYEAPPGHRPTGEKFILLDGERRWRVAKELGRTDLPAIIVEPPSDTWNILTMFHIHNVREGWQLMPTALKLKTLMHELGETNERKLNELTKLSISQIRRCKILLTFPKKFQDMMLAPPSERMKADFFIELDRIRRPALEDKFEPWVSRGDKTCIQILLDKYQSAIINSVTEFRDLIEIYRASTTPRQHRRLVSEFNKFLDNQKMRIDDIIVPGATFAKEAKEINRSARRLFSQISDIDIEAIASDIELIDTLQQLNKLLHDKLEGGLLIGVKDAAINQDSDRI